MDDSRWPTTAASPNVASVLRGPYSYFEIGAGSPRFYDPRPVTRGEVHEHWYFSKSLGMNRRLLVYTPPGYEGDEDIRYPVLYLLHGSGQTEESWTTLGRANFIMDNLIAETPARDMIIVMPYGHRERAMSVQERMGVRTNSSDIENDLISDILPFVEGRYTVEKSREGRAIAGLSMGGFQSIAIGVGHLELFSRIGSFSGGVRADDCYEKTLGPLLADPHAFALPLFEKYTVYVTKSPGSIPVVLAVPFKPGELPGSGVGVMVCGVPLPYERTICVIRFQIVMNGSDAPTFTVSVEQTL